MDLQATFDLVLRHHLWSNYDRPLWLISKLYENSTAQVHFGVEGQLSSIVPFSTGVKQGCLLAPLLNLFMNDMISYLQNLRCHIPVLANHNILALLYTEDTSLLSRTEVRLWRVLKLFQGLSINYEKSKVMVFSKGIRKKCKTWTRNGMETEQVVHFKCLFLHNEYVV